MTQSSPRAILASLRRDNNGSFITEAIWRHYSFQEMFPELQAKQHFEPRVDATRRHYLTLFGGSHQKITFEMAGVVQAHRKWQLLVEKASGSVSSRAVLIALVPVNDQQSG